MTRADHPSGTDRVAEVAAGMPEAGSDRQPPGGRARDLRRGARPGRLAPRGRPRGPDGDPGHADPRRGGLPRPVVRQGRPLAAGPGPLFLAEPDPPPPRRPARPRGRAARRPAPPRASTRTAATSCSGSAALPPSPLETAEKLEQLRVLEAGYPIAVGIVDEPSVGIDTPGGLPAVRRAVEGRAEAREP